MKSSSVDTSMNGLEEFCRLIEAEFDELLPGTIRPSSSFEDFLVFSSVNALIIMACVMNRYDVGIDINELKNNPDIRSLHTLILKKLEQLDH